MVIQLRRLYDSFVPIDKAGVDYLKSLEPNTEIVVSVKKATQEQLRKSSANRLMWAWLTDMQNTDVNEYAGMTKEAWHFEMKKRFLVPIYERENPEFALTVEMIRTVYRANLKAEANHLFESIVREASTTTATVQEFAEYLTCIEGFCREKGIWLRTDAGLMELAMSGNYK